MNYIGTFCWCITFIAFYLWIEMGEGMFSILLSRLLHLVCADLSYSDEICLWKVRLDWLIQFTGETIRSNSCCALVSLVSSHTITGFVFLTPASVNIMTADQVCRGQPGPWQQQEPDIPPPDIGWSEGGQGPHDASSDHITSHLSPGEIETISIIITKTFWLLIKTFIVTYPNFLFHCFLSVLVFSTALKTFYIEDK